MTAPPDNRMTLCVLEDYSECAAKIPEACICYQFQRVPDPEFRNLYERKYHAKYGKDKIDD